MRDTMSIWWAWLTTVGGQGRELTMAKSLGFQGILNARNRAAVTARLKPATAKVPQEGKHAAVLVPLHLHRGRPSILFTVRSGQLTRHRNQVRIFGPTSFPGGMSDEGDRDVAATALRETEEELGIPASQVDVWGALPSILDRFGMLRITPVIGYVGEIDPAHLKTNPAEVVSVFSVSVEHLADPTNHRHTKFRWPVRFYFPVFLGGSRRVWGITGFILDAALARIIPPELNYRPLSSFGAAFTTSL